MGEDIDDTPAAPGLTDPGLRLLRTLVTVLTATMILGVITFVTVFVIRFPRLAPADLVLPAGLALPVGATPAAVTQGKGWVAVVTEAGEILVFDGATGALRHRYLIGPDGTDSR